MRREACEEELYSRSICRYSGIKEPMMSVDYGRKRQIMRVRRDGRDRLLEYFRRMVCKTNM